MSIVLQGSTSGSITLQEPAVAGTNTLSLPAVTATLATEVNGALYPLTSGTAVASTSGTSIDFTGIPSWAKRITVMFAGMSTSGSSAIIIQLGTGSTTYTTSGYSGSCNDGNTATYFTSGFIFRNQVSAASLHGGIVTLANITSNTWVENGVVGTSATNFTNVSGGNVALGAVLTAIRITTAGGTDTFDAGSINIMYE
jgi:hypothetical protein